MVKLYRGYSGACEFRPPSLSYLKIKDAQQETILGLSPGFSITALPYTRKAITNSPRQLYEYHVTDRTKLFHVKQRQLLMLSDHEISVFSQQLNSDIVAHLPPFLRDVERLSPNVFASGFAPSSKSIAFARHVPFSSTAHRAAGLLYLFLYEDEHAGWKNAVLPLDTIHVRNGDFDFLKIYLTQNGLYGVIGEYSSRLTFFHCEIEMLRKGGLLNGSDSRKH